jgi:hypothetical protein
MTTKPITPAEALANKPVKQIPDFVIEAFNGLILANINSKGVAVIKQDDAVEAILRYTEDKLLTRNSIFDRGLLDVEEHFRSAGWIVTYFKPPYYGSSPAKFTFTATSLK